MSCKWPTGHELDSPVLDLSLVKIVRWSNNLGCLKFQAAISRHIRRSECHDMLSIVLSLGTQDQKNQKNMKNLANDDFFFPMQKMITSDLWHLDIFSNTKY